MEPDPGPGPDEMDGLRLDLLRTAVETYLKIAYPSGVIPEASAAGWSGPKGSARRRFSPGPRLSVPARCPGTSRRFMPFAWATTGIRT